MKVAELPTIQVLQIELHQLSTAPSCGLQHAQSALHGGYPQERCAPDFRRKQLCCAHDQLNTVLLQSIDLCVRDNAISQQQGFDLKRCLAQAFEELNSLDSLVHGLDYRYRERFGPYKPPVSEPRWSSDEILPLKLLAGPKAETARLAIFGFAKERQAEVLKPLRELAQLLQDYMTVRQQGDAALLLAQKNIFREAAQSLIDAQRCPHWDIRYLSAADLQREI